VVKNFFTTAADGKNYATNFYNLDAIISVGYRVKSGVATQFRSWATQRLREYVVKGVVLDDERLKNPDQPFDYFEELMRRIQDIRTSERRFYINTNFEAKQQAFLDFVLQHYVQVGVEELDAEKLTPLLRLRYHDSLADAVADLGPAAEIGQAFTGFQKSLYATTA